MGSRAEDGQIRGEVPVNDDEAMPKRASAELKAILEALIFASPEPLTPKAIYKILDTRAEGRRRRPRSAS